MKTKKIAALIIGIISITLLTIIAYAANNGGTNQETEKVSQVIEVANDYKISDEKAVEVEKFEKYKRISAGDIVNSKELSKDEKIIAYGLRLKELQRLEDELYALYTNDPDNNVKVSKQIDELWNQMQQESQTAEKADIVEQHKYTRESIIEELQSRLTMMYEVKNDYAGGGLTEKEYEIEDRELKLVKRYIEMLKSDKRDDQEIEEEYKSTVMTLIGYNEESIPLELEAKLEKEYPDIKAID